MNWGLELHSGVHNWYMVITWNAYWLDSLIYGCWGELCFHEQQQQAPPLPLLELLLSSTALYTEIGDIKSTLYT